MKVVEKAHYAPAKCIVTGDIDGPFIDCGVWARHHDPYVYLHVPTVEYMARELLGMAPMAEVEALHEQIAAYGAQIEELERFVGAQEQYEATLKQVEAPDAEAKFKEMAA